MRRATTTGLIGLAILLATAQPASAQWDWIKWLEELSGPGHFVLYGGETHVGCQFKTLGDAKTNSELQAQARTGPAILRGLFCDQNPREVTLSPTNTTHVWKQVRSFWSIMSAYGTGTNPLDYPAGEKREKTTAWTLTAGPVYRVSAVTDLGASVGVVKFSGSTAKSFNKLIVDPYIVIRPLALLNSEWEQTFAVRLDATWFPQGFTLEDFGATAGPLNGKTEVIFQIGLMVNVAQYLGWK